MPIQPVESIIRHTEEELRQREEDPNLTINELLELSPCEGHITTPLQTLDGKSAKSLFTIGPSSMKVGQEDQTRGRSIPVVWNTSGTTSQ